MTITVEYTAQVKRAAGVASESVEAGAGSTLQDFVRQLAERHGEPLQSFLLDAHGALRRSILVFVRDTQVLWDDDRELADGDRVTLLSPISGG